MSEPEEIEVGTVRYREGQQYKLLATHPHQRRDGQQTSLAVWLSHCPDCGRSFVVRTPASARKFEPNRRCQACRKPGVRVRGQS